MSLSNTNPAYLQMPGFNVALNAPPGVRSDPIRFDPVCFFSLTEFLFFTRLIQCGRLVDFLTRWMMRIWIMGVWGELLLEDDPAYGAGLA